MRRIATLLAATVVLAVGLINTAPAYAHDDWYPYGGAYWQDRDWRGDDWRERAWRWHMRREHAWRWHMLRAQHDWYPPVGPYWR